MSKVANISAESKGTGETCRRKTAEALRMRARSFELEAEALDDSNDVIASVPSTPRYYSAETAPIEKRAWDRAVREIPSYRPGRELLVLADDLHKWIEQHRVERPSIVKVEPSDPDAPIPFRRGATR